MSYPARTPLPSHLRQPHAPTRTTSSSSAGASAPTAATSVAGQQQPPHPAPTGQSAALAARIGEKKAELEGLRELRGLSAALAGQMQALEDKLGTLAGGTEGTSHVTTLGCSGQMEATRGRGRGFPYYRVIISADKFGVAQRSRRCWPTGTTCCGQSTWRRVRIPSYQSCHALIVSSCHGSRGNGTRRRALLTVGALLVKIPKPQEGGDAAAAADAQRKEPDLPLPLPQTLVRIPTQQNHQGPKNVDYGGD